jgi:hypothetical protein
MRFRRQRLQATAFGALLAVAVAAPAAATDGLPKGMIFFTDGTSCPAGAERATQANGRLIIGVTDTGEIGNTYGKPLANQEDRTHTHSATMHVSISSKHIAAISGGGNGQATKHGTFKTDLTTQPATSGLPFIQLLACEVQ